MQYIFFSEAFTVLVFKLSMAFSLRILVSVIVKSFQCIICICYLKYNKHLLSEPFCSCCLFLD